jgi:hypothetical protein
VWLDASPIIGHASLGSQDSHGKIKLCDLGLGHVNERGLVRIAKHGLLGNWTKLKVLRIDIGLYFV